MNGREAVVLWGANNIFTLFDREQKQEIQCRIKGKILDRGTIQDYNPLAPGDLVMYEKMMTQNVKENLEGIILNRLERRNGFFRLNKKRFTPQCIAANLNRLFAVASTISPPFRPRFLDRVLVAAGDNIPVTIIINKVDQLQDQKSIDSVNQRVSIYKALGYDVVIVSAKTGVGMETLRNQIKPGISAFFGQSGVGKSTLLNELFPELDLKTGEVSHKYNRGRHTTTLSKGFIFSNGIVIDTPGVREITPYNINSKELGFYYRDFLPFTGSCQFQPCSHTQEPGCRVQEAVEKGEIFQDRYESYTNLYAELAQLELGR